MTRMTMNGEVKRERGVGSGGWGSESHSPIPHSPLPIPSYLFALLLCFFLCLMFALTARGGSPTVGEGMVIEPTPSPTVGAQSSAQPAKDQKQEGGSVVEKGDAIVYVAFTLLVECCLPNGTRLTSGFRTANDQLAVIRHYAQAEGVPIPANMQVEKP